MLDLLEDCCEGEDEMPELHENSYDGEEPREGSAVMVEFTKLKLMLMKSEPDVHFVRRCKKGWCWLTLLMTLSVVYQRMVC